MGPSLVIAEQVVEPKKQGFATGSRPLFQDHHSLRPARRALES
ncbi:MULTISPECIES: hypothetical protein [Brachybacterium]|nr:MULTISPECIES: hypothetical protein [Brachybacterium]